MLHAVTFLLLFLRLSSETLVPLPQADVVQPTSGLFFQYLSQYSPADSIVPLTVSIPLTQDMCYLLPFHALSKISSCHSSPVHSLPNTKIRAKRFLTDIIAIGVGSAALTMSVRNTVHLLNLEQTMTSLTKSIANLEIGKTTQAAQLLHLQSGQLKLALLLNNTQIALNRTIDLVNRHDDLLQDLARYTQILNKRLTNFINAVESHFLHTSLSNIFSNRLNLQFIHSQDFPKVIDFVTSATNANFNTNATGRPLIDLVERLLVRQEVHFRPHVATPNSSDSVLGVLTISSLFTAVTKRQTPFSIYQLIPIPFSYGGMRVRLADLPVAIGINFIDKHLIQWTQTEFSTCDFQAMSVCRENPPIITHWQDTCLYQILTNSILSACRTERDNNPLFLHRFGQQWIISTNNSQQCHFAVFSATDPPSILSNQVRSIPAVTLITVPPHTTLLCERFSIPASPNVAGPPITIWDFSIVNNSQTPDFNFDPHLNDATRWPKLPYIPDDFRAVYNYITNSTIPPPMPMPTFNQLHQHPFGIFSITAVSIIILLLALLAYCHFSRRQSLPVVRLQLPPLTGASTDATVLLT